MVQDQQRTLGEYIRRFRLRHRQIHNGAPWAQEDLAVAIGTDKSHINRIERGHSLPTRQTLERMCDALALTWPERAGMLSLGGYLAQPPEPSTEDVRNAIQLVGPMVSDGSHSVCLKDHALHIWDLNEVFAYAYMGFDSRKACLAHVEGMTTLDELLDERLSEWFQKVIVDFEAYARRQLTRFLKAYGSRLTEQKVVERVEKVRAHPIYGRLWDEINSKEREVHLPTFLDHQLVEVNHPRLGRYKVWFWHSTLASDDRFYVSHHVPADPTSQALIENVGLRLIRAGSRSLRVGEPQSPAVAR